MEGRTRRELKAIIERAGLKFLGGEVAKSGHLIVKVQQRGKAARAFHVSASPSDTNARKQFARDLNRYKAGIY